MAEIGGYWGFVLALAFIEVLLAAAAFYYYLPLMYKRRRSVFHVLPVALAAALMIHGMASIAAGASMMRSGLGPEAAIPLIPVVGLGVVVAGIVFYIARR